MGFQFVHNIRRRLVAWGVGVLTRPIKLYSASEVTNIRALKRRIRIGDVLLVCGNARISHVVKVLTTSQWSHVVLYVGDRRDLLSKTEIKEWSALYGDDALKHLVVDADPVRGVHLHPVDEFVGLMVRHTRPEALATEDMYRVVDAALAQLGRQYDVRHILRLLFFFVLPWELLPERVRRFVSDFTLSESDTICSRVLSEAFYSVGYPIRPLEVIENRRALHSKAANILSGLTHRGRSAAKLLMGGRVKAAANRLTDKRYLEIRQKGTRHITPADYDLSRFFSIIKDSSDLAIDYTSARQLTPDLRTNV